MAIFGVELEKEDPKFDEFVDTTNERLKDNNVIRNPFTGKIIQILHEGKPTYVVNMQPIYFNFSIFVWPGAGMLFYWKGLVWLHIPMIAIGALGLFWSKYFLFMMLRLGAKKSGSQSKIKLIGNKRIMEVAFFA